MKKAIKVSLILTNKQRHLESKKGGKEGRKARRKTGKRQSGLKERKGGREKEREP